jgi:hypothetical protein
MTANGSRPIHPRTPELMVHYTQGFQLLDQHFQLPNKNWTNHRASEIIAIILGQPQATAKSSGVV